ncbi:MAG: hypothetical protein R2834_15275 [Rhodothermales bacterium]
MATSFPLDALPASSRLWIYALDRPLAPAEADALQSRLDAFVANWQSHGRKVTAGHDLVHGRFVLIAGVIPGGDISGCGIDASVHALTECGDRLGFGVTNGLDLFFRDEQGAITHLPRAAFRKQARAGAITGNTVVFDTSLTNLHDYRTGLFEVPAHASWHGTVFKIPAFNIPASPNAADASRPA